MRVKIGDIVEIKTKIGLAYALYTHKHDRRPRYGALLRVIDKLYPSRPEPILQVVENPIRFSTFFPLGAALSRGILEIVGNTAVPKQLEAFPIFRTGHINPKTKKTENWWLWDGEREWQIGHLKPEHYHFPIRGVWNDTLLIKRIEEGWRPEIDAR